MEKKLKKQPPVPEEVISKQSRLTRTPLHQATLAEKLKAFDPVEHGREVLRYESVGQEIVENNH